MPLGCAEIAAYLFAREMKYNPEAPAEVYQYFRDHLFELKKEFTEWKQL